MLEQADTLFATVPDDDVLEHTLSAALFLFCFFDLLLASFMVVVVVGFSSLTASVPLPLPFALFWSLPFLDVESNEDEVACLLLLWLLSPPDGCCWLGAAVERAQEVFQVLELYVFLVLNIFDVLVVFRDVG